MTDRLTERIRARFSLSEIDTGDFSVLKVSGMTFRIRAYRAAGFGHVSTLTASGFFGLMKMDTLILVPEETDLPLFSYDRILAMGNDTLICEFYDTLTGNFDTGRLDEAKARAAALPDRDPGIHWYDGIRLPQSISKKGKKKNTPAFDRAAEAFLDAFLTSPATPVTDPEKKRTRTASYVEGLLKNGGPSTDVFRKQLGDRATATLFRRYLFGIEKDLR